MPRNRRATAAVHHRGQHIGGSGKEARCCPHGPCISVTIGACALVAALGTTGAAASDTSRPTVGDATVLAAVPYPGQPQGLLVEGDVVWTTPAAFGQAEVIEWPIRAYDVRTGRELPEETMVLPAPGLSTMALAGMAVDARGRFYVLDMNGRVLRTTDDRRPARDRVWEAYATIPGLFPSPVHTTWPARNSMPVDISFDRAGNAYVADFNFPTIWRIPPGGGEAEAWFTDPRIVGLPFAVGAVRVSPDDKVLWFSTCVASQPHVLSQGVIHRMPLTDRPDPSSVEEVWRSDTTLSCPDSLVFGASGKLYASLFYGNQVLVLRPDGTEEQRFGQALPGSEIPVDQPGALAFDGVGRLLVANQALFPARPEHWAILAIEVRDRAARTARPDLL